MSPAFRLVAPAGLLLLLLPPGWLSALSWELGYRWLYVLVLAFLLASFFTPFTITLGYKWGFIDIPDARKIHAQPMPRLGGLAVVLAAILALGRNFQVSRELAALACAGALVSAVGMMDDQRGLSAKFRLAVQVGAALLVTAFGVRVTFVPHVPGELLWETLITVLWIVGVTNAVNFLDGVDGLAASMGALCASLFLAIAWPTRQGHVSFFTMALAGGCLGFLPYNWRPARVFLGDGGSTFIGFSLAGLAVMGSWAHDDPLVALSTPLLILAIPIFDVLYTTVSRIKNGQVRNLRQWVEFVGRDHLHHRLMNLGMSPVQTVLFILLVNLCLGLAAVTIRYTATALGAGLLLLQALLIFAIITGLMLLGRKTSP